MAGKKIRCRNCNTVFAVEVPADEPVTVPASASGAGMRAHRVDDNAHHLEASDLTGTHRAMDVPPESPDQQEESFGKSDKPLLKPSLPQQFPGSLVIEAWLPLALVLISGVWCISTTFSNNTTGKAWISLVRIAFVTGIFLLLVAPVTYRVVKGQFKEMLRLLPPNPRFRVAATFALPAALGYFFWLNIGSVVGLATGLVLGLVLVAAVFWLLMRLDPQEAATAFAWAAGAFLLAVAIGCGILVGASALLNQAMISAHSVGYRESPLGTPLAWTPPSPPPAKHPTNVNTNPGSDEIANSKQSVTSQPVKVAVDDRDQTTTAPPATQVAVTSPPADDVSNPQPKKNPNEGIFVNPDDDSFVAGIKQSNLSWVNHVSRPSAQSSFDFTLSPIGTSSFIGLISTDGQYQFKLGELTSSSYAEATKVIPLNESIKDPEVFAAQYSLSADGKVLLHLRSPQVQVIPTGASEGAYVTLMVPSFRTSALKAMLVGAIREPEFVIRWSAPNCEQYVQRYSYVTKGPLSNPMMIKEPPASLDACAVSANPEQQIFYAGLFEPAGRPQVRVFNLTSASPDWRPGLLPAAIRSMADFDHAELAFSPDGKKIALLLEKGDEGKVFEWGIGTSMLNLGVSATCRVPTSVELTGRRGRGLQWLNGQYLVVHGQTLISTLPGNPGVVGTLTADAVTSQQVAPGNELVLTYMGADSHPHLAVVDINTDALRKPGRK